MKQWGLALQNYHSVRNRFPSNSPWYPGPYVDESGNTVVVLPKDRKGSMHVKLMPFLEETALTDRLNFEDDIIKQFEDNNDLRAAYLNVLRCPSDAYPPLSNDPPDLGPHAITNYGPSIALKRRFR